MTEFRAFVGLDVHKDTTAVAVVWAGREEPEYRGPSRTGVLRYSV